MLISAVSDEHQIIWRCRTQQGIWIALIEGLPWSSSGLFKLVPAVLTLHIRGLIEGLDDINSPSRRISSGH